MGLSWDVLGLSWAVWEATWRHHPASYFSIAVAVWLSSVVFGGRAGAPVLPPRRAFKKMSGGHSSQGALPTETAAVAACPKAPPQSPGDRFSELRAFWERTSGQPQLRAGLLEAAALAAARPVPPQLRGGPVTATDAAADLTGGLVSARVELTEDLAVLATSAEDLAAIAAEVASRWPPPVRLGTAFEEDLIRFATAFLHEWRHLQSRRPSRPSSPVRSHSNADRRSDLVPEQADAAAAAPPTEAAVAAPGLAPRSTSECFACASEWPNHVMCARCHEVWFPPAKKAKNDSL